MLLFLISAVASCSKSEEEKQQMSRAEKARLQAEYQAAFKVAVMPTLDCLPFYVAKQQELFDTAIIDVRLVGFNSQNDCDTALVGGSVECSVGDLVRFRTLVAKGLQLDYLISTPAQWQLMASRRARVKKASQLGDKIIGLTRHSACSYAFDRAVSLSKPKQQAYTVPMNNVLIRLDMLHNNEIDAIVATEPQATQARLFGANVLYTTAKDALHLGAVAFRSKEMATTKRKSQLAELLRAYNAAVDSINKNGLTPYSAILKENMNMTDKEIAALPKQKYEHARRPGPKDLKAAGIKE